MPLYCHIMHALIRPRCPPSFPPSLQGGSAAPVLPYHAPLPAAAHHRHAGSDPPPFSAIREDEESEAAAKGSVEGLSEGEAPDQLDAQNVRHITP